MKEIILRGTQGFMDLEIPVVLGGFGDGKRCLCDKTIAELHNMEVKNARARISDNIKRFAENVDFIDLKNCRLSDKQQLLEQLGYSQMQISKAEHIYLLSERGYAKLIKIMDTDLAWEIHDKLIDEYFRIRETVSGESLIALAVIEAQRILEKKEQQIERMKPKEVFADAVSASKSTILIGELAKILRQNGIDTGEKRLFQWMRQNGYLIRRRGTDYNMPTQYSMNQELFEVKENVITHNDGHTTINKTTKVTGKGQQYFINKFLR